MLAHWRPLSRGRALIAGGGLAACLVLLITIRGHSPLETDSQSLLPPAAPQEDDTGGWANSSLKKLADAKLTMLLDQTSLASPLRQCAADRFTAQDVPALAVHELLLGREARGAAAPLGEYAMHLVAHNLPCKDPPGGQSCCDRELSLRRNTTDIDVFKQVFQCHYMRYFYSMFDGADPPRYILDAGANVGLSTVLFKLLWPEATVVSLEPDPGNYAQLKANTQGLKDVHALDLGLWNKQADIVMVGSHGAWGRVFREAGKGEEGMPALDVQGVADKMGIEAFDFVKIDIEGAEGMVFEPGSDFSWIPKARLVSLEVHDFFSGYFGLKNGDISKRIDAAFSPTGYTVVSDNEHILYLSPQLKESVAALKRPTAAHLQAMQRKVDATRVC